MINDEQDLAVNPSSADASEAHTRGREKERDEPRLIVMKWRSRRAIAPLLCAHSHCLGARARSAKRERERERERVHRDPNRSEPL